MQMYVYLIHFKFTLHHAGHYVGFGIPCIAVRTWRVDGQRFEGYIKNQKHAARFCPLCNPRVIDFQNEYVGGDDFFSEFLNETMELKGRMAFHSYPHQTNPPEKRLQPERKIEQ